MHDGSERADKVRQDRRDSVRNYAHQHSTFSAGLPGLYDAVYVDFKRATASSPQAINCELTTAFSELNAVPLYFVQSLI
eukprot:scaffold3003_cov279-Pinguiococcus_pyrenoidosus.AAC.4